MEQKTESRWERLRAQAAAGNGPSPTDSRVLATITEEMTEMDNDIGQMAAVMKAHNDTLANHQEGLKSYGEKQLELQARLLELEQKAVGSGFASATRGTAEINSVIAAHVAGSEGIAAVKAGQKTSGRITQQEGVKAALTNPGRGNTDSNSFPTAPQRAPGIVGVPTPALTLLDVLPILPVESSTYEYVHLDDFLSGADYQAKEGDEKAEGELPTALERAEIATIAAWLPASKQVLDDNSELENQISMLMSTGVRQKLERELIAGAGGPGEIEGLISQALPLVSTMPHAADRIGEAITSLKARGWAPSAVIMNPADWFRIASERAETGNGQYVLGSPRDPSPPSLWGVPVVVTVAMPDGQALVLDTATLALLDRQEVTVEASRHDGSNFRRNLVTILAELRAGLAVYAPTANLLVELNSTGG
ncbi:phage major capsid protein [uncultured Pseudomonas sp.]|uniref:phage major capsid protein n=1 Tax=uncultured Pseudomonas sp. TaxID=114707 RepID=UPI0025D63AC5|nr:phage major capsid protein [uncultured Pseudomonas sp.]